MGLPKRNLYIVQVWAPKTGAPLKFEAEREPERVQNEPESQGERPIHQVKFPARQFGF